ncbi:hypothetical protein AVEN_92209-1 [Araneus ventricosus]|uniref:Uncharacterized protein n=1 Tax=Araneus ventricosus TaxID=182803 RepID=A0A4Y2AK64_ARAVE|nr:hypothetical protein AVEN_92209-1 [Araneus ventricosus]
MTYLDRWAKKRKDVEWSGAGKQRFLRICAVSEGRSEIFVIFERVVLQVLLVNKMDREDTTARKRRLARERFARWRARQSQETFNRMRAADNEYHRRRREGALHLFQNTVNVLISNKVRML